MPFDFQPTLTGKLLTLRPLREDDFDVLFAVASDPLIWEQHPANDRYKEEVFRAFFHDAMESGGAFLVTDNRDGSVIGSSRYFGYDEVRNEVEIGWSFLARSHWGGVYNGEMKALMLRHAFASVESVIFRIGFENRRSQRAVERIGGIAEGALQDYMGNERLVYRITAQEYAKRPSPTPAPEPAG